jgi:hypothetical protein
MSAKTKENLVENKVTLSRAEYEQMDKELSVYRKDIKGSFLDKGKEEMFEYKNILTGDGEEEWLASKGVLILNEKGYPSVISNKIDDYLMFKEKLNLYHFYRTNEKKGKKLKEEIKGPEVTPDDIPF